MRAAAVLIAIVGVAQAMVALPRDDAYGKGMDTYKPSTSSKAPYPPKHTKHADDDEDCDDDDDKPYPHKTSTNDPYPPKPTKGPHGGYQTKTYTKTHTLTITTCPPEKYDCPYAKHPLTTVTKEVYTTVCPEEEETSAAPEYPKKTSSSAPEYPMKASSYAPEYPETASSYAPEYPKKTSTYAPEYPVATGYPVATKAPYVVAGAGRVEGGLLAAAVGVAAMFL
jgi:hypothetical protein